MKSFERYQNKKIKMKSGAIANGDFIIKGDITVRVKDGLLNDVEDPDGFMLPAISTSDYSHFEHWKNGVLHCEYEPAIVDTVDNYEEWWIDGKKTSCPEKQKKEVFLKPVLDLEGTGKKLKSLMNAKGITPRRVQTACGFPRVQSVYNWFNGRNLPTLDNLVVLARVLGVKVDDIIVTRDVEV